MKQLILGLAACALIMSSCTQQEITENVTDGQGQLSFSTGLGKQSARTAELMNQSMKDAATAAANGVTLRAYQETATSGTFERWYNDKLWYDTKWQIESVRFRNEAKTKYITYFSKSGNLAEVKNADADAKSTFETADFKSNFPQFTYQVNTTSKNQEDLIAGITEVPANQTDITLGLRHILSQVNFGTVGYKGANIAIQNIQIVGLYNSATYTYGAEDSYPIGEWGTYKTDNKNEKTATYEYYECSNEPVTYNPQPAVPATANKYDIYIFGDGGNWGPGKKANTFYPVGTKGLIPDDPVGPDNPVQVWEAYNTPRPQTGLFNSLMLLPQNLKDSKVTFEYRITDVDGIYVGGAGSENEWAKGEFKLDFTTGKDPDDKGLLYLGKWDQNYRYVYLIDFTDFLDGNALTFTVDVEMYPWENHNGDGDDDGIVDIMAAGQPSAANMNTKINKDGTWYIATQSLKEPTTPPTATKTDWAQVIRDEVWNLSTYDFTKIEVNQGFNLSFQNVIFNTKGTPATATTITLTLPEGFSAALAANSSADDLTISGTNPYEIKEGKRTAKAAITITNKYYYRTSATLKTGIKAFIADQKYVYGGREAIDLKTMEPTSLDVPGLAVKFISLVTPTVGATKNGIWTWNSTTQTAAWKKVTWNALSGAQSAFTDADTPNTFIYCSDEAAINLSTTFGDPIDPTKSPINIVFSTAAARTVGAGTNAGTWSYDIATKTATWTKTNP